MRTLLHVITIFLFLSLSLSHSVSLWMKFYTTNMTGLATSAITRPRSVGPTEAFRAFLQPKNLNMPLPAFTPLCPQSPFIPIPHTVSNASPQKHRAPITKTSFHITYILTLSLNEKICTSIFLGTLFIYSPVIIPDCCAVKSGSSPTFQRCLLPPSSGQCISETSVNFCQTIRRNNPAIFMHAAVRTWNLSL
jgi:hypothetical protein